MFTDGFLIDAHLGTMEKKSITEAWGTQKWKTGAEVINC